MSGGERVVLTEFPKGTTTQDGDYFFHEGRLIPYLLLDRPSCGPLYRRIPDPVPALQARIAELEGELARLKIFAGRAVRSGHFPNCSCYECETVRVMCPAEGQYDSQGRWKWKPPTPAAAKET